MTRAEIFERDNFLCRYCKKARAVHIDHTVPKAIRRRHKIAASDERYHVASCGPCNWIKGTYKLYAAGFDVSILPGAGWRCWDGGMLRETVK